MEKEQENEHLRETLQRTLAFLKEKNHLLTEARQSIVALDEQIKELRVNLHAFYQTRILNQLTT